MLQTVGLHQGIVHVKMKDVCTRNTTVYVQSTKAVYICNNIAGTLPRRLVRNVCPKELAFSGPMLINKHHLLYLLVITYISGGG